MRRLALTLLACSAAACRCEPPINMVETGFRVDESEVDFGRVLEGESATKPVHIVSTGLGALSLELTATPPFDVDGGVELEGGGGVPVGVTFFALDAGAVEGTLTVTSPGGSVTVKLKGVSVHPLECVAPECRTSVYDLETDSCIQTVKPNGSDCTPTSACLEAGKCLGGVCQGVARSCDDNNKCTVDGCAEGMGCLNPPRVCPPPTAPCRVPVCDPGTGCGEMQAADFTICGGVDCDKVSWCLGGNCIIADTPEGFSPCSPPTPCQGPGACHNKVCVRPDAGVLQPDLSLPIGGAPPMGRPMLLPFAGMLFGELCGQRLPLVALDGGFDADGGALDGGFTDGGFGCALFSFTGNGFERFRVTFPDGHERAFLHLSSSGAALLDDGGLELRSLGTGELLTRYALAGAVSPKGVASTERGTPWLLEVAPDGGTWLVRASDAGLETIASLDASVGRLALDEQGGAWVSSDTLAGYIAIGDAGLLEPRWFATAPALTDTLATGSGFAVAGSAQFIASAPDAGLVTSPAWLDDAGMPLRVQERFNLAAQGRAVVFYGLCPAPLMSCAPEDDQLRMRAFLLSTGAIVEDVAIAPPRFGAQVVEATMIDLPGFPGAVGTLIQTHHDAGVASAYLQLSVGGRGDLVCPLPPRTDVAAAAIDNGVLWAYLSRDGGTYRLETYLLTGVPLETTGWPLADGLSGQRRAR